MRLGSKLSKPASSACNEALPYEGEDYVTAPMKSWYGQDSRGCEIWQHFGLFGLTFLVVEVAAESHSHEHELEMLSQAYARYKLMLNCVVLPSNCSLHD